MFNASLSCHPAHDQLWNSSLLWRAVLHSLGAPDAALRAAGFEEHMASGRPPSAKALRDFARRWLLGIDLLVAIPKEVYLKPACGTTAVLCSGRQHHDRTPNFNLEDARRAVLALHPEDGAALIQRAAESLAILLRGRAPGETELVKAESLLEAVADRTDIFEIAQMLHILGAHQEQALSLPSVCCPPRHANSRTPRHRPFLDGPQFAGA